MTRGPRQGEAAEWSRYFAVVFAGLVVDIGIAVLLSRGLDWPIPVAAATGFLIGVAVNYLMFEAYVFRTYSFGWARLGKTYVAALGALFVRTAAVWVIARLLPPLSYGAELVLVAGAALSFCVNFLAVRLFLRNSNDRATKEEGTT